MKDILESIDPMIEKTNGVSKGLTFGENKIFGQDNGGQLKGTSIFDPALCEILYRWFSPPEGMVLDPFAGGSVRGIVAAQLGRNYVGVDLSKEQIEANREQASKICSDVVPVWHIGNSLNIDTLAKGAYDFIFSCPPYVDLEQYSENPEDLSTMDYPDFLNTYEQIIKKSCDMLKEDSFACFVVSEVRNKSGGYYGFVPDTINAFIKAGLIYYNEIILLNCCGSLPIRVGRQFEASRKIGRVHQNILVFVKGDPKKATAKIGPCVDLDAISLFESDNTKIDF